MPGPLVERDANSQPPRRPPAHFLGPLRGKSHVSPFRLPDEKSVPRFMSSTSASASRNVTPTTAPSPAAKLRRTPTPHSLLTLSTKHIVSAPVNVGCDAPARQDLNGPVASSDGPAKPPVQRPTQDVSLAPAADKPLPSPPVAQVCTSTPFKESRTLIDASEKPLRRALGTSDEREWPVLYPSRPSNSDALKAFSRSHPIASSPKHPAADEGDAMDANTCPNTQTLGEERATIKMLRPSGGNDIQTSPKPIGFGQILPPNQSPLVNENDAAAYGQGISGYLVEGKATLPQRAPSLRDRISIGSLDKDVGNKVTGFTDYTRKSQDLSENNDSPTISRQKPKLVDINSPKTRQRPNTLSNTPRKDPIPRSAGRPEDGTPRLCFKDPKMDTRTIPRRVSPKVALDQSGSPAPMSPITERPQYTPRKKSSIPVPAPSTSPQRMPRGSAILTLKAKVSTPSSIGAKSLSTIESADTGNVGYKTDSSTGGSGTAGSGTSDSSTVMRPGPQRRPTLTADATESESRPPSRTEGSRWVELDDNAGMHADEMILGRKTTPSPPIPPVPARAPAHKARDLHRMAVENELPSESSLRRENSAENPQSAAAAVLSGSYWKTGRSRSSFVTNDDEVRLINASNRASSIEEDGDRLRAVSETLAKLESGRRESSGGSQLGVDVAAARAFMGWDESSSPSRHSSDVFKTSQAPRLASSSHSSLSVRSTSGNAAAKASRPSSHMRKGVELPRSASRNSTVSSRPPVPAKDSKPASRAESIASRTASIPKRPIASTNPDTGTQSPHGLARGFSATPSNIPLPVHAYTSPQRLSSGGIFAISHRSTSGQKQRSASKTKLAMSGFRGLFHKRSDTKGSVKAGEKMRRTKVSSTGSPMPELGNRSAYRSTKASSARANTPTPSSTLNKALPVSKHPADYMTDSSPVDTPEASELSQTTALAMRIVSMAHDETDSPRKAHLLSMASALIGAVDSAKHAKIAAERAEQAAREASMHQEMTRQSLIAINKALNRSPSTMGTLARGALRVQKTRHSVVVGQ